MSKCRISIREVSSLPNFREGFLPPLLSGDRVRDDVLGLLGPQLSAHSAHSALMKNYKPAQSMDVLKSCKINLQENMMKT